MTRKTMAGIGLIWSTFALVVLLLTPLSPVSAGRVNPQKAFEETLKKAELVEKKVPEIETAVGAIIRTILTYIGVITMVLIIYAGGLWSTARGNEQQIDKAKKILIGSVIGLIIIFMAGALANFIIKAIGGVT